MIKPKGFTLIELTVTMSAGMAMMVLAIGMLHQSMSLATTARHRAQHQRSLDQLASEFRRDAHRAVRCTVGPPDTIQLHMPDDNVVTYRANNNRVTRQQPTADGRTRRELFTMIDQSSTAFESLDEPSRAVVTIHSTPAGGLTPPRIERKVVAVIGRLPMHERGGQLP